MIRSPILVTALMGTAALAQAQVLPQPQNVLQLATSATAEVPQDMLAITLQVQREGSDANAVQSQLRTVLDAAPSGRPSAPRAQRIARGAAIKSPAIAPAKDVTPLKTLSARYDEMSSPRTS